MDTYAVSPLNQTVGPVLISFILPVEKASDSPNRERSDRGLLRVRLLSTSLLQKAKYPFTPSSYMMRLQFTNVP